MIMVYTRVTNTKSQIFRHRREHFKMSKKKKKKTSSSDAKKMTPPKGQINKKIKNLLYHYKLFKMYSNISLQTI